MQGTRMEIADNADDGTLPATGSVAHHRLDRLTDSVLRPPEAKLTGQGLVDDIFIARVIGVEIPSCEQLYTKQPKIVGVGVLEDDIVHLSIRRSVINERGRTVAIGLGRLPVTADNGDTGDVAQLLGQHFPPLDRTHCLERDDGVFVKPQILIQDIVQLPGHDDGTDDEYEGDGELEDDEGPVEIAVGCQAAGGLAFEAQNGQEGGDDFSRIPARQQGGDDDDAGQEEEGGGGEFEMEAGRHPLLQQCDHRRRDEQRTDHRQEREDEGFAEELEGDVPAQAAQNLPDADLFCPLQRLGCGEIDKVDYREE